MIFHALIYLPFLLAFAAAAAAEESSDDAPELLYNQPCQVGSETKCPPPLECTNYGDIYKTGANVTVCECVKPQDNNAKDKCFCTTADGMLYRRWTYTVAKADLPKTGDAQVMFPKEGYNRAGCYLELGELCSVSKRQSVGKDGTPETPETYELCKWGFHCKGLPHTQDTGLCLTAHGPTLTPTFFLPLFLLSTSVYIVLCH